MTLEQLEVEIAALGRPELDTSSIREISRSLARAKAWDVENPERATKYREFTEAHHAMLVAREREQREAAAIDRALRSQSARLAGCGIGERSLEAAVNAQPTEALGVVRRWLPEHSLTWLCLCGAKGTGKSVAATWAVREVIRGGGTAAFRRTSELAKLSAFDAGAAELEHLKRVHLLVLDDLGTELLTGHARAQFDELLDHRHEHYARTVLTSNLAWQAPGGMAERLGERVVDRIAQAGRVVQLSSANSLRRVRA
jgi:DNA replication protein DnaC